MSTIFDNITVATFKSTFTSSFIFEYSSDITYNRNERVFTNSGTLPVYQSIIFDNDNDVLDTNSWNVITSAALQDMCIPDSILEKYINKVKNDTDKAMFVKINLLSDTNPKKTRAFFLYIAYLIAINQNTTLLKNNFNISSNGTIASTSDGSNSVAFNTSLYANDPLFQQLSSNQFGIELYLIIATLPNFLNAVVNTCENDY